MDYHIVSYSGPFGFIKPWTAVRDSETFSQQFLTPSIVAGMERKLFPELLTQAPGIYKIKGHRLAYQQVSAQTEQIQPRGWNRKRIDGRAGWQRPYAILTRGVLLNPTLHLAFAKAEDAAIAASQHLCLCRNEDLIFPTKQVRVAAEVFENDEERFAGYELIFEKKDQSFLVGYNRFDEGRPMYGWLKVLGRPVQSF